MSERWLWTQKEDMGPPPRYGHVMAYDAARQRVVLFGGRVQQGFLHDTWEWDGSAWTQVADIGPSGRWSSAMAYDESRQRLVLFGGAGAETSDQRDFHANDDTWEWSGTEWTQVADIGPGRRYGCALSYDTNRQRIVLFGGWDFPNSTGTDDTWEWDGTEWTQIADTGPSHRFYHAMVYDREHVCLVLFGGWGTQGWLDDTWEWEADAGWVKRQDIGPRSMNYPTMAYTGEHTVLFGYPSGSSAGHTWEWAGRLWTQRQDMGPPSRVSPGLAYDGERDRPVLFGGVAAAPPSPLLGDTWELAILEQ